MTDTFLHAGHTFRLSTEFDECAGFPWDNDTCGPVSEWTARDKRPGELVLSAHRDRKRFYDFQAACVMARKDWGVKGRKVAADLVMQDYNRLRLWCNDQWSYCTVMVTLLDEDGDPTLYRASLGGVEDDDRDYIMAEAQRLADDCLDELMTVTTLGEPVV
jgi:hypothetical protein